jgi:hypothetical protein
LRIGNLLRDNISKTELEVIELTNEDIKTYVIVRSKFPLKDGWGIEPIPLTEEWLLRLGFKKRVTIGHSVQYFIGINPVTQDWLFDIVWQDSQEFPFYRNGHFKIQHIHQLQNLYFALTGGELTIKNDANN